MANSITLWYCHRKFLPLINYMGKIFWKAVRYQRLLNESMLENFVMKMWLSLIHKMLLALCLLSSHGIALLLPCVRVDKWQVLTSDLWVKNGICVTSLPEHLTASVAPVQASSFPFAMLTDISSDGGCSMNPNLVLGDAEQVAKPIHDEHVSGWERNFCEMTGRLRTCLLIQHCPCIFWLIQKEVHIVGPG